MKRLLITCHFKTAVKTSHNMHRTQIGNKSRYFPGSSDSCTHS